MCSLLHEHLNDFKCNFILLTSSRSQSTAVTPSSTSAATRINSSQAPTTPTTPSATTGASPVTTPTTPAAPAPSAGAASPTQPIQLSDLQNILATMNVPATGQGGKVAYEIQCLKEHVLCFGALCCTWRVTNAVKSPFKPMYVFWATFQRKDRAVIPSSGSTGGKTHFWARKFQMSLASQCTSHFVLLLYSSCI